MTRAPDALQDAARSSEWCCAEPGPRSPTKKAWALVLRCITSCCTAPGARGGSFGPSVGITAVGVYSPRREPAMNMELRGPLRAQKSKVEIVDCDLHPKLGLDQLKPHLSDRWWQYLQTYGIRQRHAYVKGYPFPKAAPQAARRDAWPPSGGLPASDLDFLRKQHLDHYGIGHGIMNPLSPTGQGDQNVEFSAAMAR